MNRTCLAVLFALLFLTFALPDAQAGPKAPRFLVRTTAYTHTEADHLAYGRQTACGTTLQANRKHNSAAADWSRFPLGTVFKIKGDSTTYVVDDYGSALVGGNTIDIYRPSTAAMNKWGVRHLEITIVKYGDFHQSHRILAHRAEANPHCRAMLIAMNSTSRYWRDL